MESGKAVAARIEKAFAVLAPLWPEAVPLLDHRSCFELLAAVMLSAQCTDDQVNRVTPGLFARWPDADVMARASPAEVEEVIHSVGFFRTKARHIVEMAVLLVERHEGRVPPTMEALLELPGVGRKTANLVLSSCFGAPGIIVDTHVMRVALRFGIAPKADPALIEKTIALLIAPERWTRLSHALNRHGKHVCTARKPDCEACPIARLCPRIGVDGKRGA